MIAPRFALVLPAAGTSTRFGSNKLLAMLGGEPVVARTLRAFGDHPQLAAVVFAASQPNALRQACVKAISAIEARGVPVLFAPGGASRAHSVRSAVAMVPGDVEWVAVHDAARPLVSRDLIDRTLDAATTHGAAVPAMAVALTIKEAEGPLPARVIRTIARDRLWAMQTPQILRRDTLASAFDSCPVPLEQITDDAQLLELAGQAVFLIPGEERNLKLTTAQDLTIAEQWLRVPQA